MTQLLGNATATTATLQPAPRLQPAPACSAPVLALRSYLAAQLAAMAPQAEVLLAQAER